MLRTRVLIADDSPALLRALQELVGESYEVVGTVADSSLLFNEVLRLYPDVLVTDINMRGLPGLDTIRRLVAERCNSKVIVLTILREPEIVMEALAVGATGYVLKSTADRDLVPAIQAVTDGKIYLSASLRA